MVTVYILDICQLNQEALFRQQYEKQPKERQEKIMRIADRMEKNRSLGAGIVLARGLFAYGIDATQVQFRKNAHGKPDLKDRQEIHFNLSHSGNYVVGAFADTPVGIDIEHRRENVEKLVRRCLNEQERQQFFSCADEEAQRDWFLRCWTRKESAAKALGIGLQQDFTKIYCVENERIVVDREDKSCKYFLREFEIHPKAGIMESGTNVTAQGKDKYRIAVCAETPDFAPAPVWIKLDETV